MGIRLQRVAALALVLAAPTRAATIRGIVTVPQGLPSAADAVVYIEQVPGRTFAPPAQPLVIDQRNYTYVPHVLPALVGSTVAFPNSDPDVHNTYSVADCCVFNLGSYPKGEKRSAKFDRRGVAEILCNIHPQMGAYVLVLQNQFFAVTDASGRFEIHDAPAGDYTLVVWHEVLPALHEHIRVATADLDLTFTLRSWQPTSPTKLPGDMALVPAGEFVMGADDRLPNEKPCRKLNVAAFRIDRTEVTNARFCEFLNALRHNREEGGVTWLDLDSPECKIRLGKKRREFVVEPGFENLPVVCVSWYGAAAYAQWLGKRLPSEAEWEKAARGTDGREWPWGNQFGSGHANASGFRGSSIPAATGLRSVGSFRDGASPYGSLDMAGNAWEWTASDDGDSGQKITRGGAFDSLPLYARCSVRVAVAPTLRSSKIGFRCAQDAR